MLGLSSLLTAATTVGVGGLLRGQLAPVAKLAKNMRKFQYSEEEIMLFTRALFLDCTKQDRREAWIVLDRRRMGSMARSELLESLAEIFGPDAKALLHRELDRLPSHQMSLMQDGEQMVVQSEFAELLGAIAVAYSKGSLVSYVAAEASEWAGTAFRGAGYASKACQQLDLDVVVRLPPHLLPQAGAVAERMLTAGYSAHEASTAVAALYAKRDPIAVARLWGIFDKHRNGHIPTAAFDAAMPLLTDVVVTEELPLLRKQMGFVDIDRVHMREFEVAKGVG